MADVTDAAFRELFAKYGKPDVIFTEFTSADGLCSPGREKLLINFKYSKNEHPIVAQLFSANPEKMREAAKLVKDLGFDGVDINMGCPDRSIVKQGAGGAMIKTPQLAREVIRAAIAGAGGLPVSVKTRVGFSKDILEEWLSELLKEDLAAITIHARTVKELSLVPARWERVAEAVKIRNAMKSQTLIIGNGDVSDVAHARELVKESGADGVMLGRAMFGNPWLFSGRTTSPTVKEKLDVLIEHTELFEKYFSGKKNFSVMKKHFKAYVSGFDGAKELRTELMECNNAVEVKKVLQRYI